MIRGKSRLMSVGLFAGDLVVTLLAFYLAYLLRAHTLVGQWEGIRRIYPLEEYAGVVLLLLGIWSVFFLYFGLHRPAPGEPFRREVGRVFLAVAAGTVVLATMVFLFKLTYVSRLLILLFSLADFLLLILFRGGARWVFKVLGARGINLRSLLIVGTGERAKRLAERIEAHRAWGLRLSGFIALEEGARAPLPGYPLLGSAEDIPAILHREVVDEILFVISKEQLPDLEAVFLCCEEEGVRTRVVMDFFPHTIAKVYLEEFCEMPLLTFSTTPTNPFLLAVKRAQDLLIASVALVGLAPLIALIALGIKLDSAGPVIYRQIRCGLHGRRFVCLKFRSMVADAEERRLEVAHLNEMDGPVFKARLDPRITWFGGILRKTSLDELPQLWNVLKGDMSIAGPRPPIPEEVEQYAPWQRRRLSMKPGITCLWQIRGRNLIPFEEWMRMDLEYIDTWSLWLDLKILLKTIPVILTGKGAG